MFFSYWLLFSLFLHQVWTLKKYSKYVTVLEAEVRRLQLAVKFEETKRQKDELEFETKLTELQNQKKTLESKYKIWTDRRGKLVIDINTLKVELEEETAKRKALSTMASRRKKELLAYELACKLTWIVWIEEQVKEILQMKMSEIEEHHKNITGKNK